MNEFIKICLNNEGSVSTDDNCEISFYGVNPNFSPSFSVSNAEPYLPLDRSWDGPEFIRYVH